MKAHAKSNLHLLKRHVADEFKCTLVMSELASCISVVICANWPFKGNVVPSLRRKHRRSWQLHLRRSRGWGAALSPDGGSRTLSVIFDLPSTVMVTNDMYCTHRDGYFHLRVVFVYCLNIYFLYWNKPLTCPPVWVSDLPLSFLVLFAKYYVVD